MAVPSYTTDLVDIDLAQVITNWYESTDTAWDDGGGPGLDSDTYIQGTAGTGYAVSQTMTKTTLCSILVNATTGLTIPSDGAVLIWQAWNAPTAMDTYANGGMRVLAGSGLAAFYWWASGGNNRKPYPEGLWQNVALNPSVTTGRTAVGSPTGTWQYFGSAVKPTSAISKGNPHIVDAVRYGRCEARFAGGQTGNYCTFAGYAAVDDTIANRWGLIMSASGGFLWKGLMTIGYGSAAEFVDSDVKVTIDATVIVTSAFNAIEVRQTATKLYWTRVSIKSLSTVSPGTFTMIDNADVRLTSCAFEDWGAWVFLSNAILTTTTWLRCGQITAPGCYMTGCSVLLPAVDGSSTDKAAVIWNVATDPSGYLDNMTFSRGAAAHHAIEFGTSSPTSITVNGWTTSGFNASNGQYDSTFYVARTTGAVTINVVGGSGNFSYKSAGATVTVIQDAVTTKVTCLDFNTKAAIQGVVVTLIAAGSGPFPYNATVTITRTGSTAYVSHTAHGLATGDKVRIRGANQAEYNRIKVITKTSDNEYTYPVVGTPDTPATGTIKADFCVIDGTTGVDGSISDSRVFSSDQAFEGYALKGTSKPLYKRYPLTGTVDSADGLALTAIMIPD